MTGVDGASPGLIGSFFGFTMHRMETPREYRLAGDSSTAEVLHSLILRYRPELRFKREPKIQFHRNTSTMASLSRRGEGLTLRLHDLFTKAPLPVLDAVVRAFFTRRNRDSRRELHARILDFVEKNRDMTLSASLAQCLAAPRGCAYDLEQVKGAICAKFLPNCPRVRIGWSHRITPSLMGKWIAMPNGLPNVVMINRLLDSFEVPLYYLQYIVFHELLHEVIPIRREHGRWVHHPAEFRRRERQFPNFERALRWERENIARLFNAHRNRPQAW